MPNVITTILSFILLLVFWPKAKTYQKILFVYILFSVTAYQVQSGFLFNNYAPLVYSNMLIEATLLFLTFVFIWKTEKKYTQLLTLIYSMAVIIIITFLVVNNFKFIPEKAYLIYNALMLMVSLVFLYYNLHTYNHIPLSKQPSFWIASGVFTKFTLSFFMHLLVFDSVMASINLTLVQTSILFACNILFCMSIYVTKYQ